jgi:microsomal dipeptidase-like Zn-dependent dipeptidase
MSSGPSVGRMTTTVLGVGHLNDNRIGDATQRPRDLGGLAPAGVVSVEADDHAVRVTEQVSPV